MKEFNAVPSHTRYKANLLELLTVANYFVYWSSPVPQQARCIPAPKPGGWATFRTHDSEGKILMVFNPDQEVEVDNFNGQCLVLDERGTPRKVSLHTLAPLCMETLIRHATVFLPQYGPKE